MKKNLTDLLYREIAGSGECSIVDKVTTLLERQLKGQKLTKQEETLLVEAEKGLLGILGDSKETYCPDMVKASESTESQPLPFSSFAEGLTRLQNRIKQRGTRPQLKSVRSTGTYRPDTGGGGAIPINSGKITAIVKMARVEREKLSKAAGKIAVRKRRK